MKPRFKIGDQVFCPTDLIDSPYIKHDDVEILTVLEVNALTPVPMYRFKEKGWVVEPDLFETKKEFKEAVMNAAVARLRMSADLLAQIEGWPE